MINQWFRIAFSFRVVRRGLKYALAVGFILVAINHGDRLLVGPVPRLVWLKIGLTVFVPYCVFVLSSVGAILDLRAGESSAVPSASQGP